MLYTKVCRIVKRAFQFVSCFNNLCLSVTSTSHECITKAVERIQLHLVRAAVIGRLTNCLQMVGPIFVVVDSLLLI